MPLCSSVLVVFGLLYLKQAQQKGMSTWTSMIAVSWSCALMFPVLAVTMGGRMHPQLLWQPATMGCLFLAGQLFTFLAVEKGDVSIAAPVLGVKVLIVPATAPMFVNEQASTQIWLAAAIAVIGIGFIQVRDESVDRAKILTSVGFALLAAVSMTLFDLLIARWAENWGAVLMALQAIGMTLTIGHFQDVTRVNIVYSLRGLWGVLLTWLLAQKLVESDTTTGHRTMAMRLLGALLIGVSVVISVNE
jgi:uncharacterized membrane protein